MDKDLENRKKFKKAYDSYMRDMKWLRKEFGIIQEPTQFALKGALSAAIDAVISNDHDSVQKSIQAFESLHKSIIYSIAWDLLERTKESLKLIRETDPSLFEQKRKLWIQASWALSEGIYKRKFQRYHDSITIASQI